VSYAPKPVTAEEIRAYREKTGAGMHEAKRELSRVRMAEALGYLRFTGTLEEKVEFLLDRFEETLK
jgi:translation elongation factor EF-Ts